MANKSILQIAPTPFFADRGCHIRIEGVIRCLTNLGYQNVLCTYHHGRDVKGVVSKRITPIKNYTQTAAGPSKYKLLADWRLLWLSVAQYRHLKPMVIHAHLHEGLLIGLIIKYLFFWRRTPVVADMQGSLTGELDSHNAFSRLPFLRWPTYLLERMLMWRADTIVCSSQHALDKIKDQFNVPERKISLVQDGADSQSAISSERRQALLQQHGLPTDKRIVIYSGALLESKGLAELKQLILSAKGLGEQVHFLVIGYPSENLQPFLDQHGLHEICTLTGQLAFEVLPDYLGLADIAVDPKNSDAGEGSGKMLNYLAAGLAILAFDTPNNREFLATDAVLAEDDAALAANLLALLVDQSTIEKDSAANLARFEQYYSWLVTQEQLAEVYSRI